MSQNHPKYGGVKWIQESQGNDKTCPIDDHIKMISPSGDVVEMPVATGSNIPRMQNMGYRTHIIETKLNKGWLIYDDLSEKEREKVIAQRKGIKEERSSGFSDAFKTEAQKITEASTRNVDRLLDKLNQEAEKNGRASK